MTTPSSSEDREFVLTRILNAPLERVWDAWTQPERVAQWWGPNGFTNTIHGMEVKPGGVWRFIMHGPDGTDYPNKIVFHDVQKPERLTYDHGDDDGKKTFFVTTLFEDAGKGKTKITLRMQFDTPEERNKTVEESGAIEGGNQTLGRLEDYLKKMEGEFVISRTFNAPREKVWEAFTEVEHLKKWWGPKGFKMSIATLDFKPGGLFHYGMESPDGVEMWGKFVYREILPQERIVFVNSFSDKEGGTTRHPMAPNWPLEMLNTLTLEEQEGKTTITLRGCAINATEEETKTYNDNHESMRMGFGGTWDQLEEYLEHFNPLSK